MKNLLRRALRLPIGALESLLERCILSRARGPAEPPAQLFILGLPRSGTTLVYQYIVHRLHVAYFTNGVGSLPEAPCLAVLMQTRLHPPYRSDFKSEYGKVAGPLGPREAGAFWGRHFDLQAYQDAAGIRHADRLARSIACVQALFRHALFVNKNVKHLLRIGALAAVFPRARFLAVDREPGDVALSLWRARREVHGDPEAWFSVRPRNYPDLQALDPIGQVAAQVAGLREQLERDLESLGGGRALRVDYGRFCADPESVFRLAPELFAASPQKNPPHPGGFEARRSSPRDAEEEKLLARLREMEPANAR